MIKDILTSVVLNTETKVNLEDFKKAFIIAHKETKSKKSITINSLYVTSISFQVLIDSGKTNKHIAVDRFNINFDSNDDKAFISKWDLPNEFYIKPVAITANGEKITKGETNISVYVNIQ